MPKAKAKAKAKAKNKAKAQCKKPAAHKPTKPKDSDEEFDEDEDEEGDEEEQSEPDEETDNEGVNFVHKGSKKRKLSKAGEPVLVSKPIMRQSGEELTNWRIKKEPDAVQGNEYPGKKRQWDMALARGDVPDWVKELAQEYKNEPGGQARFTNMVQQAVTKVPGGKGKYPSYMVDFSNPFFEEKRTKVNSKAKVMECVGKPLPIFIKEVGGQDAYNDLVKDDLVVSIKEPDGRTYYSYRTVSVRLTEEETNKATLKRTRETAQDVLDAMIADLDVQTNQVSNPAHGAIGQGSSSSTMVKLTKATLKEMQQGLDRTNKVLKTGNLHVDTLRIMMDHEPGISANVEGTYKTARSHLAALMAKKSTLEAWITYETTSTGEQVTEELANKFMDELAEDQKTNNDTADNGQGAYCGLACTRSMRLSAQDHGQGM